MRTFSSPRLASIHPVLIGIAGRAMRRGPMVETQTAGVSRETGLSGDYKGTKHPTRQITVLSREDWQRALDALAPEAASPALSHTLDISWTTRRANLFVEGVRLPRVQGAILQVGAVQLEITGQTYPCRRMDEAIPGLLKALAPEWRGGVTCRVLTDGEIKIGDAVKICSSPPEPPPRSLPG